MRQSEHNGLNRELKEYNFNFSLTKVMRKIAQESSLYKDILRKLKIFYGAEQGCIALYDRVSGQMKFACNLPSQAEWCEEALGEAVRRNLSFLTANQIIAPLYLEEHGQSIGAIVLRREREPFTSEDKAFLRHVAEKLAAEIYRRRSLKLQEVITRLEEKTRPIDVYNGALRELHRFIKYDHSAAVLILDRERNQFIVRAERITFAKKRTPRKHAPVPLKAEMAQALASRRERLYFSKSQADPWSEALAGEELALVETLLHPGDEPENAILCLPLTYAQETLAFLKLSSAHPGAFSFLGVEEEMVLKAFTHLLATTIYNSELYYWREQRLKAIHAIGHLITQATALEELGQRILRLVLIALNLEIGSIHLWDDKKSSLRLLCDEGKGRMHTLKPDEGIVGMVATGGKAILINDVTRDSRYIAFNPEVRSTLAVPIIYEDEILGVFSVESTVKGRFSKRDEEFLSILANEVALALKVFALLRQTEEQAQQSQAHLKLLRDITRELMNCNKLDEVYEFIARILKERLPCETAAVFFYEQGALRRKRIAGLKETWFGEENYIIGQGLTGQLISREKGKEYGKPILLNVQESLTSLDETLKPYEEVLPSGQVKHMLLVPLNGHKRTFGALRLINKLAPDGELSPEGFDHSELELLCTIADKVASTISDLRKQESLKAIYNLGRRIILAQDRKGLYRELLESISVHSPDFSLCTLHLIDDEGNLTLEGWASQDSLSRTWLAAIEYLIKKHAFAKEGIVYIKDVRRDEPRVSEPGGPQLHSILIAPLRIKSTTIGFLTICSDTEYLFYDYNLNFIENLINQVAVAIQNARLFSTIGRLYESERRRARQLAFLNEVGRTITSTLNLSDVLNLILNKVMDILDVEALSLLLLDEEKGDLVFKVSLGPGQEKLTGTRLPLEKGIAGAVVREGQPLIVNDVRADPRWSSEQDKLTDFTSRAILCVPLISKEKVIGALELVNKRDGQPFQEDELNLLSSLASQASIAVENARLYEDIYCNLHRKIEELKKAQQELEEAHAKRLAAEKLSMLNAVAGKFAHHLNNVVGMIPAIIKDIRERVRADDPDLRRDLEWLEEDIRQLMDMADQLCRSARRDQKPEPINIRTALASALEKVLRSEELKAKIKVKENHDGRLPPLPLVPSQILEIFSNVISNAVDAMSSEGGELGLTTRLSADGHWVEIEVSDTGNGMTEEVQARVFDLFFSTKSERGMGLGLWWSKTCLQRIGGDISVRSKVGEGSTFTVRLPVDETLRSLPPFIQKRFSGD